MQWFIGFLAFAIFIMMTGTDVLMSWSNEDR
jgi:hypothetical protein